ncbi:hypothetical protein QX776_16575 [Alteromonadaceae bacterium BrNp21-10]|nr:hypothetical protein [Alteromonadaceae bacterium BrNp21-10]
MDENNKKLDKRFQHLGPIDHEDKSGIYMDVLSRCIATRSIKNLAISGPYAAGKSSIINRYINQVAPNSSIKPDKILTISLSDFDETKREDKSKVKLEDLELRILQQILYTVNGADLPHSRFTRIVNPKRSIIVPVLFLIWSLISVFFVSAPEFLLFYKPWSLGFFTTVGLVCLWSICTIQGLEWFYYFFKSHSFGKISIKNLEFERKSDDHNSVLSKYSDEILYFFDEQPYEIVIFEDLDRFCTSAIFSKLHEVNKLLNNNKGINRRILFIYALKDSMFVNNDRTKFFDFILPVVQVTGTANSEDTFIDRNNDLEKKYQLEKRFLRNIAQFVTEPRIIHNTFNEYVIYKAAINSNNIDPQELFAVVLYKNLFVHDFEELLCGSGSLYELINNVEKYRIKRIETIEGELADLELRLANAEKESVTSEKELVNIYIGELLRNNIAQVNMSGAWHHIKNIETVFELMKCLPKQRKNTTCISLENRQYNQELSLNDLEEHFNPGRTIDKRLLDVQDKNERNLKELHERISVLHKDLEKTHRQRLSELCKESSIVNDKIDTLSKNDIPWQQIALVKYLIREGYLNENYSLYTTIFNNKEHWTQNDQAFYLNVQNEKEVKFDAPVDNSDEVIERLADYNFETAFIFNVALLDYILKENIRSPKALSLIEAIKNTYASSGKKFINHYLINGANTAALAKQLLKTWPPYLAKVFDGSPVGSEAKWLIGCLQLSDISEIENHDLLFDTLENNPDVFITDDEDEASINAINIIDEFNLNVKKLQSLTSTPKLLRRIINLARFSINFENIEFTLKHFSSCKSHDILVRSYNAIMESDLDELKNRVVTEIDDYITQVMLATPQNTHESEQAIIEICNNPAVSEKLLESVVNQQSHVFENLNAIKKGQTFFFKYRKVSPSWPLLETFYDSKQVPIEEFIDFINQKDAVSRLASSSTEKEQEKFPVGEGLINFLLNEEELDTPIYNQLISFCVTQKIDIWPDISEEKKEVILELQKINLNPETFKGVQDNPRLLAKLIVNEPQSYLRLIDELDPISAADISEIAIISTNEALNKEIANKIQNHDFTEYTCHVDDLARIYRLLPPEDMSLDFIEGFLSACSTQGIVKELFSRLLEIQGEQKYIQSIVRLGEQLTRNKIRNALLTLPEGDYKNLTNNSKKPKFICNSINESLLNLLVEKGVLEDFAFEGEWLRARKYRVW